MSQKHSLSKTTQSVSKALTGYNFESQEENYDVKELGNSLLQQAKVFLKSLNLSKSVRKDVGKKLMTEMKLFLSRLSSYVDETSAIEKSWAKNSF